MIVFGVVSGWAMIAYLVVVSVPLVVSDCRWRRLPNVFVMPGYLVLAVALVGRTQSQPP
ncbi:hypothetical protein [Subtercola frigoramans]|uniref:Flp pilus assembly protein protease CpaA n=1 Tax=Subtercola frigoramans TaxID=120298 RepID=A0ABS2L3N8_9MICO|nr:hypothetical protein [Subtercola frigoramans]MBM7471688.1 Flp pilus assembly protein protease CpaA [Subtercola frigoramans]